MKPFWIPCAALACAGILLFAACSQRSSGNISSEVPGSSSSASSPSAVPEKESATPSQFYQKLVAEKEALLPLVRSRVEEYRNNLRDPLGGHHSPYPNNFPNKEELPLIVAPHQFAVRQESNLDMVGSIYLAVRIDETHELRMDAAEFQNDEGNLEWGSGNSWFATGGEVAYEQWVLSDTDIHSWTYGQIYQEALRLYGAEMALLEGEMVLRPIPISLYYDENTWESASELAVRELFSWYFSSTFVEGYEYKLEAYLSPKGEDFGWFFPQDMFEARVQQFFDVTTEQLRADPIYYDAALAGYSVDGGGGIGERPPVQLLRAETEGDLHFLTYRIDYEYSEDIQRTMVIRTSPDGTFQFVKLMQEE